MAREGAAASVTLPAHLAEEELAREPGPVEGALVLSDEVVALVVALDLARVEGGELTFVDGDALHVAELGHEADVPRLAAIEAELVFEHDLSRDEKRDKVGLSLVAYCLKNN